MKTTMRIALAILGASLAQVPSDSFADPQDSKLITMRKAPNGVEYVAGGVGQRQQEAMEQIRKDFSLQLVFARPQSGYYLADIKVKISNEHDETVLDVLSPAPMLFVNLPAGAYRVKAEFEGTQQVKPVNIRAGLPSELVYYFEKR